MNYFRLGSYLRLILLKNKFSSYKNKKILDIGANYGEITKALVRRNEVTGIDTDKKALDYAKMSCPEAKFIRTSAAGLPFGKNSFDIVICLSVLEHIKKDQKVLKEISRVLKKKGELVLTIPSQNFRLITPRIGKCIKIVNTLFKSGFPSSDSEYVHFGLEGIGHVRRGYTIPNIQKMLIKEKLKIVFSKSYWHFPSRIGYLILTPLLKQGLLNSSPAKFIFRIFYFFDKFFKDDRGDILIIARKTG